MHPPFIVQMDVNTVVGLLGLVGILVTAIVAPIMLRRDHYTKQVDDMADSQGKLEQQVNDLNDRMNKLYDSNGKLRGLVRDYTEHDIKQVEYIREVGHWMASACQAMDVDEAWLHAHPKPRLPESIRHQLPKNKQHLPSEEEGK